MYYKMLPKHLDNRILTFKKYSMGLLFHGLYFHKCWKSIYYFWLLTSINYIISKFSISGSFRKVTHPKKNIIWKWQIWKLNIFIHHYTIQPSVFFNSKILGTMWMFWIFHLRLYTNVRLRKKSKPESFLGSYCLSRTVVLFLTNAHMPSKNRTSLPDFKFLKGCQSWLNLFA